MKQGKKRQYAHETLPQGYELYEVIDLGKDPKLQKRIALSGLAVIAAMIAMALPAHAFKTAIPMHPVQIAAAALGTLVGFVVYLFLHEGVHGVCIRWFSGVPAEYGFQLKAGMAYAGSRYFFSKSRVFSHSFL